jgi:hypothetical protein
MRPHRALIYGRLSRQGGFSMRPHPALIYERLSRQGGSG